MGQIMKQLWTDPTAFRTATRTVIAGAGQAIAMGAISGLPPWVGAVLTVAAFAFNAGEVNPPQPPKAE